MKNEKTNYFFKLVLIKKNVQTSKNIFIMVFNNIKMSIKDDNSC
jgi:hypothetical protein